MDTSTQSRKPDPHMYSTAFVFILKELNDAEYESLACEINFHPMYNITATHINDYSYIGVPLIGLATLNSLPWQLEQWYFGVGGLRIDNWVAMVDYARWNLGGLGGMLPQKKFWFSNLFRAILVHSIGPKFNCDTPNKACSSKPILTQPQLCVQNQGYMYNNIMIMS